MGAPYPRRRVVVAVARPTVLMSRGLSCSPPSPCPAPSVCLSFVQEEVPEAPSLSASDDGDIGQQPQPGLHRRNGFQDPRPCHEARNNGSRVRFRAARLALIGPNGNVYFVANDGYLYAVK